MRLINQRVAWVEGILLEPQHFQQLERYMEHAIDARARRLVPNGWGFISLTLDEVLLAQGKVGVSEATGVFADGTVFDMPADAPLPLPCEPGPGSAGDEICLALPIDTAGVAIVDLAQCAPQARFGVATAELADRNYGIAPEASPRTAQLQVGMLRTRLVVRSAATTGETLLPIARISECMASGTIRLDPTFVPPLLDSHCAPPIIDVARETHGLIALRLAGLSRADASSRRPGNLSDLLELMLVQSLSEYRVQLQHLLTIRPLHPERLYATLLGFLGRLAMLPGANVDLGLPTYDHAMPGMAFHALAIGLRQSLALVIESPAIPLDFRDRGERMRVCVADPQWRLQKIVFIVMANMSAERLRVDFPLQTKFGPVEKISRLIDLQLPGAVMANVAVPPRHVPYYPDGVYFEINANDLGWDELVASSGMALSVVGEFPGLRIEAWGLRRLASP